MDPNFIPIFQQQVASLGQNDPYSWISSLLRDIATRHIIPPMTLRPDGELFLLVNIGNLIVIPWDGRHGQNSFKNTHIRLLEDDMNVILRDAVLLTRQKGTNEVSARTLLEATARQIAPLATLRLNIWGP